MIKFLLNKQVTIAGKKVSIIFLLWFLAAIVAASLEMARGKESINNYLIFENVYTHVRLQQNLYAAYPNLYFDTNHYGPLFSVLIAPFALLPLYLGCLLWCICNAAILLYAINQLSLSERQKNTVLLIALIEMTTALHNVQFNPMLTAWILLSFTLVKKEKDFWATLFIAAGFLVKIYGIAGLILFLFSKNKIKFVVSFCFWLIVLFCLPMLISSYDFIIQSYKDWFNSLVQKNGTNNIIYEEGNMQDISVMGLIRRPFKWHQFQNIWVMAPAAVSIMLPAFRFAKYKNLMYQLTYISVVLLSIVLFSSSAESATYIIAVTGFAIWYVIQEKRNNWLTALLIFVLVLTSISATDLFPRFLYKSFVRPYALKALPCFIAWMVMIYQLLMNQFNEQEKKL